MDVLVSVAAQKRGISPYRYITSVTRNEFELDVTGWLSSVFYPIGEIAKGFSSDDGDRKAPAPVQSKEHSGQGGGHSREAITRARRASSSYSWYRKSSNSSYNVHNLDSLDQGEYRKTVGVMAKQMASMGKA